jgi:hypothetical protein
MQIKDTIIDCPNCGEEFACYKTYINENHSSYSCFGCGYITNDFMVEGYDFEQFELALPELHKDIKMKDCQGRVWYPQVVNIQGKGTVFANGKSPESWQWSAIKSVELTEEEKQLPKFKNQTHKSDSTSLQNFGKDFVEACDYIGFFDVNKK